jgi:hypothetical protein
VGPGFPTTGEQWAPVIKFFSDGPEDTLQEESRGSLDPPPPGPLPLFCPGISPLPVAAARDAYLATEKGGVLNKEGQGMKGHFLGRTV